MIQRQQSLWLLLATIGAILSFKYPFYAGGKETPTSGGASYIDAGSNFFLIILTVAALVLAVITIFLYKERKRQLRFCFIGLAISILLILIYFNETKKLPGTLALWSIFVFVIPVGFIMAARGIWKDQKLVKSLDKLR